MVITFQHHSCTGLPEVTLTDGVDTVSANINPLAFPMNSNEIEQVECVMRYRMFNYKQNKAIANATA